MIYLRVPLLILWLFFSCAVFLVIALFRWGDLNLDRDFGKLFTPFGLKILGLKVETQGTENLTSHQPCIYVGNHQGALDVMIFGISYPERTITIGKKEIIWIPFFGLFFAAAGNIMINRHKRVQAIAGLNQALDVLKVKKASIWIFPEGTRNRSDQPLLPFKKGAFHMALSAGVPIVPILASPMKPLMDWKNKKLYPGTIQVRVLPPIFPTGFSANQVSEFSDLVRSKMLEALPGLTSQRRP